MNKKDIIGWIITAVWFFSCVSIIVFKIEDVKLMPLNEWGDFVAGFAAPLALLWIIIGYRLQKEELIENRKVLETQQAELSKQVNELAKQNKILENSIEATNKLSEAVNEIASTYEDWKRYGQ